MKKLLFFVFIFINIFTLHSFADENGYIVKLKCSPVSLFNSSSCSGLKPINEEENIYSVKSLDAISDYIAEDMIEHIEPNFEFTLFSIPNDTYYNQSQWNLQMINAPYIWESGCFGQEIKIAVIDSGANPHYDLKGNLLEGYNYINSNTDVTDYDGHGTFVSGIIAATANNSYGIAGLSYGAKIVPLKTFSGEKGSVDNVIAAVKDAVDKYDCNVINMSFGGPLNSLILEEEIKRAVSKGVIVISASGNNSSNIINYPASYEDVISVSSIDSDKVIAKTSTYNEYVDVAAPGENVKSLVYQNPTSLTALNSGTSFAAPHVSALAALCLNVNPQMNAFEFMEILKQTSEDLGAEGRDDYYGYGLINAKNVLELLLKDKEFFVSPFTFNNQTAQSVIYNNTNEAQNVFSIFKNSSDISFSKKSINAKSGSIISFASSSNSFSHYLWKSNLSPVLKNSLAMP